MIDNEEQVDIICDGVVQVYSKTELLDNLNNKAVLTVKAGFDPTAPDLHLGHYVLLRKLRELQTLGHRVVFLVGDFTARIGDPSGKTKTRPELSEDEIKENLTTYTNQVTKVLDMSKVVIKFNSSWIDKLKPSELIKLTSKYTVARMLEREDFKSRYEANKSISMHEFLYPLLQGYDSVALGSDIEIGGTDQTFNLLVGRHLQQSFGQNPQVVLTLPLLEGLDGEMKMSKSLGNYIGLDEDPDEIFGKIMSISDSLMWRYFELVCGTKRDEINKMKVSVSNGMNPRDLKYNLAESVVSRLYDENISDRAKSAFIQKFKHGLQPDKIDEFCFESNNGSSSITQVLKASGLTQSTSEARRLVAQKGIKIDGQTIADEKMSVKKGDTFVIQVGKRRFKRVVVS
ncbi:MAG: tyrosine--tRNA ligase [Pseudomonadota bacterium]|nr:tyrosine--tRNA ligase [Pseudomonadota bacterium]